MKSKGKMIKVFVWSVVPFAIVLMLSAQPGGAQAATFVVNSTADVVDDVPGDGDCATDEGVCTLRAAIMEANFHSGHDEIRFDASFNVPQTIVLAIPGIGEDAATTGDLDITANLTIDGTGTTNTIINGAGLDRVFHIVTGSVTLSGITVTGGNSDGDNSDNGGGIYNSGTLALNSSAVSGNLATRFNPRGGGIYNAGTLTLNNTAVSGNFTSGINAIEGGGIYNNGGTVTLNNSTVSGNSSRIGGGFFINGGTLTINNSTVSGNNAAAGVSGIYSNGALNINNATVSGNNGVGIYTLGTLTLDSSTVSDHPAGIWNFGTATIKNSIVANNAVPEAGWPVSDLKDCNLGGTFTSLGHNLDSDGTCNLTGPGDHPNTSPNLGPLQNNGGPTETHALLPGSPAIDAVPLALCTISTDQRGVARPQGAACDIGSVELTPLCTQTVSFSPAANYAVGTNPGSVAIGELDGDGKPDLAVANANFNNTVSILLGTGTGSFGGAMNFGGGTFPYSVAIGDLNGDGKPDLAVANYHGHTVSILLGTGTGSFGSATAFAVGTNPGSVAIGDLNGDGKPDLAVANQSSNNVSILLSTGGGAFGGVTNFAVGSAPISVAIGDFNDDGKPDLAVANQSSNNVSILLSTGGGAFGGLTNFAVGSAPLSVAIGDLDGDGKRDLAVANYGSNNVSILLGTGGGDFGGATNLAVGTNPTSVAIGDLNGDDKPDLAVANAGSNTVSILVGTGTGTGAFGSATNFAAGPFPWSVAIGDLNGDGRRDLAVANAVSNTVSILLNTSLCPNQPPLANAGPDQTVEANSPSGASVTLNGSGSSDPDGDPLTYNWIGPFGTVSGGSPTVTLPLGMHTVTLTVDDGQTTAADIVNITVQDVTPPETTITSAVDGNGAAVASDGSTLSDSITFAFAGTDAVGLAGFQCSLDGTAYAPCASPLGYSTLEIGSHNFQVKAFDAAGNVDSSTAGFTWTIVTPAQAIQNLITTIGNMGLPGGVANSLKAPLGQASNLLNDNNPNNDVAACGKLNAFINQVNAKVQNGQLTPDQASQLLQAANAIKASLGC